ncbi:DNA (cytosine-5-)-methyltransferase [Clostridium celatum]|uniref:DNA (cytosine-5-)-methyltransferase n=1 Tax=Clostridium celatum TaxID=36834 RepID=UPI000509A9E9
MRFVDFFAGIGGFRKGLEQSGHKCVFSCEIDNNARKSYSAIHNVVDEVFANDIKNVDITTIPEYDIFCGGFPCQPFSRAGRREGFNDLDKGNLFFDVINIVRQTRPRIVFLENVKGLLTAGEKDYVENEDGTKRTIEVDKGCTFKRILEEFNNIGYDVEWQLINSADYIAHKRERVYIIAYRRDNDIFRRIFPIRSEIKELVINETNNNLYSMYSDFESYVDKKSIKKFKLIEDKIYTIKNETPNSLEQDLEEYKFTTVSPWGHWGIMINGNCVACKLKYKNNINFPLRDMLQPDNTVDSKYILSDSEVEKQRHAKSAKVWEKSGNKMGNMAFPDNLDKPSRTLTANSSGREMMVIGFEVDGVQKFRKLTSLEYWKLQGFSEDDYNRAVEAGVPETQLKKQAGNAVTVNVIREIGNRLA